jgi:hypothetical protein
MGDVIFPCSGYHTSGSNALSNVGSEGNYWAKTSSSALYGDLLHFNVTSNNASPDSFGRENGMAVRCVLDLN